MGKRSRRPNRTKISYKELQKRVAHHEQVKAKRLTRAEVETVMNCFLEAMLDGIVEFEEIHIRGFGQLYRYEKGKRIIRHPKTKEEIVVAPHLEVDFKMGAEMRRRMGLKEPVRRPRRPPKKDDHDSIPTDF